MARIPSTQKLLTESFPDQKDWIAPLFYIVNKFINDVITFANGGIQFGSNIQGQEFEYDFIYRTDAISLPQSFVWNFATPPKALSVVAAFINDPTVNRNFSSIMVNCTWQYTSDNKVQITDVIRLGGNWSVAAASQLSPGYRYKIRVRVTP